MNDPTLQALIEHDRLAMLVTELMEFWLDGDEPPIWLVDEYYDQHQKVLEAMNSMKLFETVNKHNSDYYEEIQEKIKSSLDKTPDLF